MPGVAALKALNRDGATQSPPAPIACRRVRTDCRLPGSRPQNRVQNAAASGPDAGPIAAV